MNLEETNRKDLVNYRLEKAKNTFAEIPVLMQNEFYGTAANRLYYACFYATTALLINDGYETHTHSGVKTLLGQQYIKENKIERRFNFLYEKLFNLRQTSDYEDWIYLDEEAINPLLEPAEEFIHTIENLINNNSITQ